MQAFEIGVQMPIHIYIIGVELIISVGPLGDGVDYLRHPDDLFRRLLKVREHAKLVSDEQRVPHGDVAGRPAQDIDRQT